MSLLDAFSPRRVPSLGETTALLDEALSHRTKLAAIELDEARSHAQTSALMLSACAVLGLLAGFAFTLTLAAIVWDSPHRGWWLGGLCSAYLVGAMGMALALYRRLQIWEPFAEIRSQLQQDHQCLVGLMKSPIP
jgi:uncharacterized membrane protein YqjE